MNVLWGVVVLALSLLGWGGQVLAWFAPVKAAQLTVTEAEADVEPTYWADIRGEALWDMLTLWTMVAAGALLVADHSAWAYFGLVGGGMYAYFAGRGISTRLAMQRRGLRIGSPESVRIGFIFLAIWGVMALITIVAAWKSLR
jgi:hypothetical protein